MTSAFRGLTFFACAAVLGAQDATRTKPAGLETDWEIAGVLKDIGAHAARLAPLLDKIDARAWVEKGASDTWLAQLQSSKEQADALARGAQVLAGRPERLSASIELFFRMESLETMLNSLQEGIRKYQSPADAQALAALGAQNGANRDRFQKYIVNLAAEREQEFQVMDREAQRCRGVVTEPPPRSGRKR